MAQLTAQTLPIPEDSGSNPGIDNFYITPLLLTVCRKYENKEKEAGNGPFFLKRFGICVKVKPGSGLHLNKLGPLLDDFVIIVVSF